MVKKAQLKIQEMSFMLLATVLFFILVGIVYLAIMYRGIHSQKNQVEQDRAIIVSQFISQSGEFSCGSYCVDSDRLMILANITSYKELWPVSYIKVQKVLDKREVKCEMGNYPDCSYIEVFRKDKINDTSSASSFIALCRYELVDSYATRICELAKLIVGYEVK
ncbi:hypothetical protein HYW76_04305 [Candidatus Pacearchaeota archaeon]|nr:hypothetical protein [Candidatus Pacearchaeota archaeon]